MSDRGLPPRQESGRARILIADDDEPLRRLLGTYLEDEGYLVHLAADGQQALEAAPGFAPDLVLLDVTMPRLDGLEVARRLRAAGDTRGARILMVSGLGGDGARAAGLGAGADEYLTKPLRPGELLRRIEALLREAEGGDAPPRRSRRALTLRAGPEGAPRRASRRRPRPTVTNALEATYLDGSVEGR